MPTFEDLEVFKAAVDLTVHIHRLTACYPKHELYGLTSQIRRSSGSVVAHIAEGQGRLTLGEWRQLLSQGRGSLYETEGHLIVSIRLGYLTEEAFAEARSMTKRVGRLLQGLIRYVMRREAQARSRKDNDTRRRTTSPQPKQESPMMPGRSHDEQ